MSGVTTGRTSGGLSQLVLVWRMNALGVWLSAAATLVGVMARGVFYIWGHRWFRRISLLGCGTLVYWCGQKWSWTFMGMDPHISKAESCLVTSILCLVWRGGQGGFQQVQLNHAADCLKFCASMLNCMGMAHAAHAPIAHNRLLVLFICTSHSPAQMVVMIVIVFCFSSATKSDRWKMAGILGMFVTMTNDVAIGLPIVQVRIRAGVGS